MKPFLEWVYFQGYERGNIYHTTPVLILALSLSDTDALKEV